MAEESNLYGSYAYKSARSRSSRGASVEDMALQGRAPSFDQRGNIRGFRSRPGAPLSARDSMSGLGIPSNPRGGLSDAKAWGSFFKGNSPTGVRMGYAANSPSIEQAAFPLGRPETASSDSAQSGFEKMDLSKPSLLTDPKGFGSLDQSGYLDNVIGTAQNFLRKAKGGFDG